MVESQYQYSAVHMQDHEGLQVVDQHSTLEHYKPAERTSPEHPEVVDYSSPALALDPPWEDPQKTKIEPHYAAVADDDLTSPGQIVNRKPARRYCGLTKRTCILVSIAIGILIAIALGAGLGVALGNRSKSQGSTLSGNQSVDSNDTSAASSYTARSKSGFAVLKAGDSTGNAYAYYQGRLGAIRELVWQNSQWVAESTGPDIVVAAQSVMDSTPITAASYPDPSGIMRLVFYFNKQGQIMMVNRTTGAWSSPLNVLSDAVVRSGNMIALDSYVYSYNSLRVVFASGDTGMRSVGLNGGVYGNGTWNGRSIPGFTPSGTVDADSGVGVNTYGATSQLFTRNNVTGALNQWYTIYNPTTGASLGYRFNFTNSLPPVAPGSSISACSTDQAGATVSVFYQATDGSVVQVYSSTNPAQPPPDGSTIYLDTNYRIVGQVPVGTKFRAVYNAASAKGAYISSIGAGPMVYYQLDGSPGMSYIKIAPDGSSITPGVLAG